MRLHEYVRAWAARTPQAPAVGCVDGTVTYAELDALAERQAVGLRAAGVAVGDRVVVWAAKSVPAVAAMQAVLRVGAAYVPVAPANPALRVGRIAADARARLVLTDPPRAERARAAWAGGGATPAALAFAELESVTAAGALAMPAVAGTPARGPDDAAYVLYTSGSTGAPKGVCLSHRNGAAFVEWAGDLLAVGAADRLANHAPFNFDLSVFDLYAAFRAGASVHLVPEELAYAPQQLVRFIRDTGITVWYSVPSALVLMIRDGGLLDGGPLPALRACVFAGEPMPIQYVHQLREAWPGVRLLNWYGPTETNVCTWYEVSEADAGRARPLPIGRPACGDTVLLDPVPGAARVSGADGPAAGGDSRVGGELSAEGAPAADRGPGVDGGRAVGGGPAADGGRTVAKVIAADGAATATKGVAAARGPAPWNAAGARTNGARSDGSVTEGEIVVSGPTVMLGYSGHPPHRGPYRTGDLGRLDRAGNIEYLGRLDNMVKLRGHRVEPAEIEAVIAAHPRIADVAVVVVGAGLDARLHAAVVPADGVGPSLLEIKAWCAERLPTYMIVDALRLVDTLPLTLNGKTDRAALVALITEVRSERV